LYVGGVEELNEAKDPGFFEFMQIPSPRSGRAEPAGLRPAPIDGALKFFARFTNYRLCECGPQPSKSLRVDLSTAPRSRRSLGSGRDDEGGGFRLA
jgi:hypothetical protein